MIAQLVVLSGPDQGWTISLAEGQTLTIGRGEAVAARLGDPHVSRTHCRIEVDQGRFRLHDAGSSGGTFVNAQRITQQELKPGDVIRIGGSELRFQLEGAPEASTLVEGAGLSKPRPAPKVTPLPELVGTSIAHFQIEARLATGNTGMVFRAMDAEHDRAVALKILWPETSKDEEAGWPGSGGKLFGRERAG